ncbi:jg20713, partial [Pararge aegeria aegeria]
LENIMVTSWLWVLLTDIASFKPTFLPDDNPADFSYFFDTSRRRLCYVAPERFVRAPDPNVRNSGDDRSSSLLLSESPCKIGELIPSMDIFSTG